MSIICNCDLQLYLRIAGHGQNHIVVNTDEGDGITITQEWTKHDPKYYEAPEKHHYDEWADQLELIAEELRKKGESLKEGK